MPRRQFNADLASAMGPTSRIREGFSVQKSDTDGELILVYTNKHLAEPFNVHVMCPDLDEYPKHCQYLLFTDHEDPPKHLTTVLADVQYSSEDLGVLEVINMLSTALMEAVEGGEDLEMTDVDANTELGNDDDYYDDNDFDEAEELDLIGDDDLFGLGNARNSLRPPTIHLDKRDATVLTQRIKRDFLKVKQAGFRVSILQGMDATALSSIASMSVRADKLGLSEEALEAWDISLSDYIIVLLRIDGTYPTLEKLLDQTKNYKDQLSFRIGKCDHYKTTLQDALLAFNAMNANSSNRTGLGAATIPKTGKFKKTLVSTSLDQFMTEAFTNMTKLRHRKKSSWDEANEDMIESIGRIGEYAGIESNDTAPQTQTREQAIERDSLPKILQGDHLREENVSEKSLPLIAMNFAMEYFVNCAKYCLRCHRKVYDDFGALKPYVCSNPLCLFQYMTMGIGPSTEHEVISQPRVVDLLVSFCYQALGNTGSAVRPGAGLQSTGIRELPVGLRIKAPSGGPDALRIHGQIDPKRQTFTLDDPDKHMRLLGVDQWVVVNYGKGPPSTPAPKPQKSTDPFSPSFDPNYVPISTITRGELEPSSGRVHAKIKSVHFTTGYLELELSSVTGKTGKESIVPGVTQDVKVAQDMNTSLTQDAYLLVYDTDIDDLELSSKVQAMKFVLDTLPPIKTLREYLMTHSEKKIRDVPEVTPAAASLLEWIVASNRSCIVQTGDQTDHEDSPDPTLISGMADWVQFRFAQGSPDKEIRFNKALQDIKSQQGLKHETRFAWHGSPLANWHSIVRTGLNYSVVSHGRAYGDGVYFSSCFDTSHGYASFRSAGYWPSSELKVDMAISLNEIINYPGGYKSVNPHYVVDQLDWFQTRFLFIKCNAPLLENSRDPAKAVPAASSKQKINSPVFYAQDPTCIPTGPGHTPIKIPMAAMPSSRVDPSARQLKQMGMEASANPEGIESESDDPDDVEWLRTTEEERGRLSGKSSVDSLTVRDMTTKRPMTPTVDPLTITKFTPGLLDLSTLPLMAPPTWANFSAQRGISTELKKLQAIQSSTPLADLGYYIDFEKVENLFQWIVELHSFPLDSDLGQDMKQAGVSSIVLEMRFGAQFPFTPPFVRIIRPRMRPYHDEGGGNVTLGGAMCMELLTNSGWSPANAMEAVLVQVRDSLLNSDPRPARLDRSVVANKGQSNDYGIREAIDAYKRAAAMHGWEVPKDIDQTATGQGGGKGASSAD